MILPFSILNTIIVICLGSLFLALATRTWVTSLSVALMITICHSNQLAHRFSWIYHIFGWIVPICISLIVYFHSLLNQPKEISILGVERFGKVQLILSIFLLALCILINTISLLRITRRTYQLRHDSVENNNSKSGINEIIQPLIDDDEQEDLPFGPIGNFSIGFYLKYLIKIFRNQTIRS